MALAGRQELCLMPTQDWHLADKGDLTFLNNFSQLSSEKQDHRQGQESAEPPLGDAHLDELLVGTFSVSDPFRSTGDNHKPKGSALEQGVVVYGASQLR